MDVSIDISIDCKDWERIGLPGLAERACHATLRRVGLVEPVELSILATDDSRIADLNADFRDRDAATNVLSWPAQELSAEVPGSAPSAPEPDFTGAPLFLGDIALAWQTCASEAAESGRPVAAHVTHLVVHGLLHLLGYDHIRDEDADLMEGLEIEILGELGLPNPY